MAAGRQVQGTSFAGGGPVWVDGAVMLLGGDAVAPWGTDQATEGPVLGLETGSQSVGVTTWAEPPPVGQHAQRSQFSDSSWSFSAQILMG